MATKAIVDTLRKFDVTSRRYKRNCILTADQAAAYLGVKGDEAHKLIMSIPHAYIAGVYIWHIRDLAPVKESRTSQA